MSVCVKICGLTNRADALFAIDCGADYIGFVLYPRSPRYVSPEALRTIAAALPPAPPRVGVFVNCETHFVADVADACGLAIVQLHGRETAANAQALGPERVWKAFDLKTPRDVTAACAFPAAAVVVDAMVPGQWGGSGKTGDWRLAKELADHRRVVLAGGLNAGNVAMALEHVRPDVVDVSSGVEASPGRKDPDAVRRFIDAVRGAHAQQRDA